MKITGLASNNLDLQHLIAGFEKALLLFIYRNAYNFAASQQCIDICFLKVAPELILG